MLTTLDIDADVLQAVEELAVLQGNTTAAVVSQLLRRALEPESRPKQRVRNGVPLLTPRPGYPPLTMEMVNKLRDE